MPRRASPGVLMGTDGQNMTVWAGLGSLVGTEVQDTPEGPALGLKSPASLQCQPCPSLCCGTCTGTALCHSPPSPSVKHTSLHGFSIPSSSW